MSKLGLASHLRRFPSNEIAKGALTMRLKALKREQNVVHWPTDEDLLPRVTWPACELLSLHFKPVIDDGLVRDQAAERTLVVVASFVHDVSAFVAEHPGGPAVIRNASGKDVTSAFFGGTYGHSNAAYNVSGNTFV
jgi:stearoyl-CoA desaturase (delta-9 desaturase)